VHDGVDALALRMELEGGGVVACLAAGRSGNEADRYSRDGEAAERRGRPAASAHWVISSDSMAREPEQTASVAVGRAGLPAGPSGGG
jgi:hypothetical protein